MGSAEPGPLEEEDDVGLRVGAMGAENPKLVLVPAGEAEAAAAAAADTAGPTATPDFWANKVPEHTGDMRINTKERATEEVGNAAINAPSFHNSKILNQVQ